MAVTVVSGKILDFKGDAIALPFFEGGKLTGEGKALDLLLGGEIASLFKSKEFSGKAGEVSLVRTLGRAPQRKVFLVGLGKRADLFQTALENAFGAVFLAAKKSRCKELGVELPKHEKFKPGRAANLITQVGVLASYEFKKYVSKKENKLKPVELVLFCESGVESEVESGAFFGKNLAEATNHSRDLANEPPNVATPEFLAQKAREVARKNGLRFRAYGPGELKRLGMNAFLSVSSGSAAPPRLIVMEYAYSKKAPTIAVVGKGITFDSGGIDLKPSKDMEKMKLDKSAACSLIASMGKLRELGVKVNVVGIAALAENMPGGGAYKPGDIIKSMSGKTIEVGNTDAEGRLTLADAITFAKRFKPKKILDVATLTGACYIALGDVAFGLMGNNEKMNKEVLAAAEDGGERAWELPLWKEYEEKIKSDIADIKNTGDSGAGTITAAAFLKAFADPVPWVHLDIAGTTWRAKNKPYMNEGNPGSGTRTILAYLVAQK